MTKQKIEAKARAVLEKSYARRLTPDPAGGYVASISEFPGCIAEGDTADEALANLQSAAQSWLQVAIAHGHAIREPSDVGSYSGRIALRIPRTLHQQVAELAQLEHTSINQVFVSAIAHYVGSKRVVHDLTKLLQTSRPQANYYVLANNPSQVQTLNSTTSGSPVLPVLDSIKLIGNKMTTQVNINGY